MGAGAGVEGGPLPRVRPYRGNLRELPQRDFIRSPQRDFGPASPGDFPGQNGTNTIDFVAARPRTIVAPARPRTAAGADGTIRSDHLYEDEVPFLFDNSEPSSVQTSGQSSAQPLSQPSGSKSGEDMPISRLLLKANANANVNAMDTFLDTRNPALNSALDGVLKLGGAPKGTTAPPSTLNSAKEVGDHKGTSSDALCTDVDVRGF